MTTTDGQNPNNQNDNDLNLNFDFILDEDDQKKQDSKKEEEILNFGILQENNETKESLSQKDDIKKEDNNQIQETIIEQEIKAPDIESKVNINSNNSLEEVKSEEVKSEEIKSEEIKTEESIPGEKIQEETIVENITPGEKNTEEEIENTKPEEVEIYQTSMENFNNTINKLNEAKEQGIQKISSEQFEKQEIKEVKDENIVNSESNIGVIDLDNILGKEEGETKTTELENTITQNQIIKENLDTTTESINNKNPYETITNQTNIDNNTSKEHKKHLIKVIGITAACVLGGFFILKTMYPIQFNSTDQGNENIENTNETLVQENPFQQTENTNGTPIEQEQASETTEENTNETTIENEPSNEIIEENTQTNTTTETGHNANTQDIDPFQELDNIQTKDEIKKEETISTLQDYVTRGKEYLEIGNQTDNRDIIKYSTYIKVKGETYLKELETSETLDIQGLDIYLAQSSGYLIQLENLKNEELSKTETNNTGENQEIQESQTNGSGETNGI